MLSSFSSYVKNMGVPYGFDHRSAIKNTNDFSHNQKQAIHGDTLTNENWNGVSIEDATILPFVDDPSLLLNLRLIQDYGSSKVKGILNEYTCDDVVHGVVEINNISSRPIEFDAFYLSLGGHMVITDPENGLRQTKTILRMDDDQLPFGLPLDRILRSHSKYRREFAFTIPFRLLESVCQYGVPEHYELPPSMGLDRLRYRNLLRFTETLGYARANEIGTPIWTLDQAENVSINYSLQAVLVGKGQDTHRGKCCILKQFEHFVRIIPSSFWSGERTHTFLHDDIFVECRLPYRRRMRSYSRFLKKFLYPFIPSGRSMSSYQTGIIVISAPIPQRTLPYRSPRLIAHQNSVKFKNSHEQRNRQTIREMIPSYQREPLRWMRISIRYVPKNVEVKVPPKLLFVEAELLSITGKSTGHHIPYNLSYTTLLDQNELDRLRLITPEFADLDVSIIVVPDAFGVHKTKKWYSSGWSFTGLEYERDLILDFEYPKRFYQTLIPSFTSCMCFRVYCIRITVIFDGINRPHLIIPIDVRNMFK